MKIYHTETQADFDALMNGLEVKGIETLEKEYWENNRHETVVFVHAIGPYGDSSRTDTTYGSLRWAVKNCPDVPIAKYKAKVDEKMKFTKENVGKLFNDHDKYICFSINDLRDEILKLDDTPEKVAVPKCFDDWYKEIEVKYPFPDNAKTFALWNLCKKGFGYDFERADGREINYWSELWTWLNENRFLAIDAVLYGYTIKPEQLYYIPLPHLETSDGIQQVLSKRKGDKRYFASRPAETLKQRYTKEEIAQVPEVYKPYAKPIEEE